MILSAAGPETSIKALRAGLLSDAGLSFEPQGMNGKIETADPNPTGSSRYPPAILRRTKDSYRCYAQRLGYGTWHLVAVARTDGLMASLSESALYRELRHARLTTPFLRSWVPWLAGEMVKAGSLDDYSAALTLLPGFQVRAGLVQWTTDQFDALVTRGLQSGEIEIPKRKESAA